MEALGKLGDSSDNDMLISILRHPDQSNVQLRSATIRALIEIADQRTVGLLSTLGNSDGKLPPDLARAREQIVRRLEAKK